MLFGRKPKLSSIVKRLESCVREARLSAMKLRVAYRFATERRPGVDKVVIQTALTGFPISQGMMANMYVSSAESSARKAWRNLIKAEEGLRKAYPELHSSGLGDLLAQAAEALKRASDLRGVSGRELESIADEVEGAASVVSAVAEELRGRAVESG